MIIISQTTNYPHWNWERNWFSLIVTKIVDNIYLKIKNDVEIFIQRINLK